MLCLFLATVTVPGLVSENTYIHSMYIYVYIYVYIYIYKPCVCICINISGQHSSDDLE